MGTRNLICVVKDGEYKVAQYGQWDGYPAGQGATILKFLRSKTRRLQLRKKLSQCYFVQKEEIDKAWEECGAQGSFASMDVANKLKEKYPQYSRDTGARLLYLIAVLKPKERMGLDSQIDFAADSLYCEWIYVVNLDSRELEVYCGFNTHPLPEGERFKCFEAKFKRETHDNKTYYPVRLLASYGFDRIPTKRQFVKELNAKAEGVKVAQGS